MNRIDPKPHGARYPWAELFRRRRFTLRRNIDYFGPSHGMASTARQAAKRLGIRLNIAVYDDHLLVFVGGGYDLKLRGRRPRG